MRSRLIFLGAFAVASALIPKVVAGMAALVAMLGMLALGLGAMIDEARLKDAGARAFGVGVVTHVLVGPWAHQARVLAADPRVQLASFVLVLLVVAIALVQLYARHLASRPTPTSGSRPRLRRRAEVVERLEAPEPSWKGVDLAQEGDDLDLLGRSS